tara:strand:- start:679 stop:1644 length:966 start_codon:yes stop_codon:yes gene_type:complete
VALVGLFLFNALAGLMLQHKPVNYTTALVAHKWQLLKQTQGNLDMLILGDSSGNQAVDPVIFKQQLDIDSLNLCTTGGTTLIDDRMMLEDYLQKHDPPKAVMLVHVYDVWFRQAKLEALSHIPVSVAQLSRSAGADELSLQDQAKLYTYRYLSLYHQNQSLQSIILKPHRYLQLQWDWPSSGFNAQTKHTPEAWKADLRYHTAKAQVLKNVSIHQYNLRELQLINALAKKHQMQVLLVMSPISSELYKQPIFGDFYRQITDALAEYAQQHDQVQLIFEKPLVVGGAHMQSADHVLADAAAFYTTQLAQQIRPVFEQENSQR